VAPPLAAPSLTCEDEDHRYQGNLRMSSPENVCFSSEG